MLNPINFIQQQEVIKLKFSKYPCFLKLLTVNMMLFLLRVALETFRDYFKALAFLSYFLVIIGAAIIKYVIQTFKPEIYPDVKPFFQLSIFLFIPLTVILGAIRFKRDVLYGDSLQPFARWGCIATTVILHILLVTLFIYILIA